jgi:hypothetical protein
VSHPLVDLGQDSMSRDLFLMSLGSWDDWPRELKLPSQHFCLLLAGDAQGVSQEAIRSVAEAALARGCVYLCAWGPDCVRVEDWFDQAFVLRNIATQTPETPVVMTTSHEGETLDTALTFLTEIAWPDDAYAETCRSALIVVVGNDDWVASIRQRFGK